MKTENIVGGISLPAVNISLTLSAGVHALIGTVQYALGDKDAAASCFTRAAGCAIGAGLGMVAREIVDSTVVVPANAKKA